VAIPEDLLAIMACPECRSPLEDRDTALVCRGCGLHYPVRDAIPVMLPEEAYRPEEAP
jgi:uncharacterized protein YbaR (Trm112 family)